MLFDIERLEMLFVAGEILIIDELLQTFREQIEAGGTIKLFRGDDRNIESEITTEAELECYVQEL